MCLCVCTRRAKGGKRVEKKEEVNVHTRSHTTHTHTCTREKERVVMCVRKIPITKSEREKESTMLH